MTITTVQFDDLPGARVLAEGLGFPEGPRFFNGEIYFSDMNAVRAVDLDGNVRLVAELPTRLALGLQVTDDGTVYAAACVDSAIYKIADGKAELAVDLADATSFPVNEFVLLPNGAFLVAAMGFDLFAAGGIANARPGHLLLVSPDGSVRRTGPDLLFPNGVVLRDNGRTLWIVETMANTIHRLRLDADGEVTGDDLIALQDTFSPDGMSLTADGAIWYADMSRGGAVLASASGGGEVFVEVPEPHAPCCLVFQDKGEEWLAIGATVHGPRDLKARTARVVAAPLAEILAAAGR
jgi:sugar lactone lactonase YvrE